MTGTLYHKIYTVAGPNQQTTKQPQTGRTQVAPRLPGTQPATEPNGNGIIFLRGVRSDNGRIILTRDDTIRLQDSIVALQSTSKEVVTLPIGQEKQGTASLLSIGEKNHQGILLPSIGKEGQVLLSKEALLLGKDTSLLTLGKDSQFLLPVKDKDRKDNEFGHVLVNANDVKDGVLLNKRQGQILVWGTSGSDVANGNVFLREKEEEIKVERDEKMCVPVGSGE